MPQQPDDLSRIIREMAANHVKKKGYDIDEAALDRISTIPQPYASQKTIPVDLAQLDEMIQDIVELTTRITTTKTIDPSSMERALLEVKCHYIWFC
jgi:hypothetical protein